MSTLTKSEREGLDDVFLSIHSTANRYEKMKELSSFIINSNISTTLSKLLKHAKIGLKKSKSSYFLAFLSKKKKYLSK